MTKLSKVSNAIFLMLLMECLIAKVNSIYNVEHTAFKTK